MQWLINYMKKAYLTVVLMLCSAMSMANESTAANQNAQETADRSEIFRKMFHTEIYQELQNRLRDAAKERSNTYSEKRRSILQYLDNIVCPEDAVFQKELAKLKKEKTHQTKETHNKKDVKNFPASPTGDSPDNQ